ncbi:MAG TPA: hypothetical protein VFA04_24745 [Bryobacteraceae bacterium]|nr:hypothetical protein [Bryobacteraceae bacterium]
MQWTNAPRNGEIPVTQDLLIHFTAAAGSQVGIGGATGTVVEADFTNTGG